MILAAKTGKLTDQQYEIYLKLIEEDPEFREQAAWEDFLEDTLPVSKDASLYEAFDTLTFAPRQPFMRQYGYAIAASVTLLLITGWLIFYFGMRETAPEMMSSRMIEVYNGENKIQGQLGYTQNDIPAGEIKLQWWKAPDQQAKLSYRLCDETLHLYFREPADTVTFNQTFKLSFLPKTQEYFLESQDNKRVKLLNCSEIPKPIP